MMKNSRRSNALRRYLRLLEAYCPDTLHVWMPRFDGRRTSSATYDLVSGTALNLGSGAAFSGDGKRIVLESGEIATATINTRGYVYQACVLHPIDWSNDEDFSRSTPKNIMVYTNGRWSRIYSAVSTDGSNHIWDNDYIPAAYFSSSPYPEFVVIEFVCNANEYIARSPQETSHDDKASPGALYSSSGATFRVEGSAEVAAVIYGGATTSAPLESLASVVKRGESGSLLTEMFRELIT